MDYHKSNITNFVNFTSVEDALQHHQHQREVEQHGQKQDNSGMDVISLLLKFESQQTLVEYVRRLNDHYWVPYVSVLIYILVIYALWREMRNRKPFRLKISLALWNLGLALFSITATIRSAPELYAISGNVYTLICKKAEGDLARAGFWIYAYNLSKIVELGDTIFLVLRKRPLTVLHCYHHASVLLYVWHVTGDRLPAGALFAFINVVTHSVMYSYYFAQAVGYRVSRKLAMCVTGLQITQMLVGMSISIYAVVVQNSGFSCDNTYFHSYLSFYLYLGFTILFGNFYYQTYVVRKGRRKGSDSCFRGKPLGLDAVANGVLPVITKSVECNGHSQRLKSE